MKQNLRLFTRILPFLGFILLFCSGCQPVESLKISGVVWDDVDRNGMINDTEPLVEGATILYGVYEPPTGGCTLNHTDTIPVRSGPGGIYSLSELFNLPTAGCPGGFLAIWVECPAGLTPAPAPGPEAGFAQWIAPGTTRPAYTIGASGTYVAPDQYQYTAKTTTLTLNIACNSTPVLPEASAATTRQINCRRGSSTAFPVATVLPPEEEYAIQGVNPDGTWLLINVPDTGQCWVRADVVQPQGDLTGMPIYQNAPTPTPGAAAEPAATAGAEEPPPAIPEYCMCLGNCNPCATVCGGVGPACTP